MAICSPCQLNLPFGEHKPREKRNHATHQADQSCSTTADQALLEKSAALGTALAFMMGGSSILRVGYLFNLII